MNEAEKDMNDAYMEMQTEYFKAMTDLMQATVPRFAKDDDEGEWTSLVSGKHVYNETDIEEMQETALKLYYTDPTARGIIDMMVNFVVGRDARVTPVSENPKVIQWWDDFYTSNGMDLRIKEMVRRAFRDGESFLRLFKSKTGGGRNIPIARFVDPCDIRDPMHKHSFGIQTNPDDVEDVRFYILKTGTKIRANDIIHTKINVDSNVKRGVSFLVGIAKYIVKYGGWIDDRIMLNKVRSMFSMIIKVAGITPESFASKYKDVGRTQVSPNDPTDPNKQMMRSGSVLVATPGLDYEFKNLNVHAPDTKDDGRLIELMVAKGTGLTEYVVRGDASNSNYSSTMVSESPMVRMLEAWQDIFQCPIKRLYENVIKRGIRAGKLPRNSDVTCDVNFAALIHRDLKEETEAYISQIAAELVSRKTISERLGYDYSSEKGIVEKELKEQSEREFQATEEEESEYGEE
jgi:hypothetical protein